jgi:hypothetical protein
MPQDKQAWTARHYSQLDGAERLPKQLSVTPYGWASAAMHARKEAHTTSQQADCKHMQQAGFCKPARAEHAMSKLMIRAIRQA